jgi:predicted membrane-bound dolichyl-phosphate-mannose-protein mannosyltransferase
MENTTTWGTWLAYAAIVVFLLLVLLVFARTMMLFGTLTLMPVSRVVRRLARLLGRRAP